MHNLNTRHHPFDFTPLDQHFGGSSRNEYTNEEWTTIHAKSLQDRVEHTPSTESSNWIEVRTSAHILCSTRAAGVIFSSAEIMETHFSTRPARASAAIGLCALSMHFLKRRHRCARYSQMPSEHPMRAQLALIVGAHSIALQHHRLRRYCWHRLDEVRGRTAARLAQRPAS